MTTKAAQQPALTGLEAPREALARMDASGIHVVSADIADRLSRKNLSASLVTGVEGCPARWMAESFILPDMEKQGLIDSPVDDPRTRGSLFHKIMELFFAFPQGERTPRNMHILMNEVCAQEEYCELAACPGVMDWLVGAIRGYYAMGARPQLVKVASMVVRGRLHPGLELFVSAHIGHARRSFLGYIDRLSVDPRDPDSYVIEDWKTGAKCHRWNPATKSSEGLPESRQQMLYTAVLRANGSKVSGARLVYPVAREMVTVNVDDEMFMRRCVHDVERVDTELTAMENTNTYGCNPNFLCSWCPLAKVCPSAQAGRGDKMRRAMESQPEPDVLRQGIDI